MSLGDLTKQLAMQALTTPDKPKSAEAGAGDCPGPAILAQVQAMQKALKDDEELLITFRSGGETVLVREIYMPTWQVTVLGGLDPGKATTRVIAATATLQLVCKVAKVPPGAKPSRVALVAPRPKPD